jgi:hypothetical protein
MMDGKASGEKVRSSKRRAIFLIRRESGLEGTALTASGENRWCLKRKAIAA